MPLTISSTLQTREFFKNIFFKSFECKAILPGIGVRGSGAVVVFDREVPGGGVGVDFGVTDAASSAETRGGQYGENKKQNPP